MKKDTIFDGAFNKEESPFYGNKYLIGNGYFGVRGTMEEYKKENMPCVNMAGIYDKVGEKWRESVNAQNPSEVAVAETYHGPFRVLGNPHRNDETNTSFHSQISSVFKLPVLTGGYKSYKHCNPTL